MLPMISEDLRFPTPRTEASVALNDLLTRRAELVATANEAERRSRFASDDVVRASRELEEFERRAASEPVSTAERTRVEKALTAARGVEQQPWDQRAAGARRAIGDCDHALGHHIATNLDVLLGELAEEGEEAVRRADQAAQELVAAFEGRERVANRVATLASAVRLVRPGDVRRSRMEGVARAARELLERGGEASPELVIDPRAPRGSNVAAPADEETWAFS
jgi:hypothetical protein